MDNNNFCLQPWIGIHAWPDGRVFPCCMYNSKMPLGNINNENINNLVNNEQYKNLRRQLLNNEQPEGCKRCYELEKSGIQTLRQTTNYSYSNLIPSIIENYDDKMGDVKYLDIRFSNICNFKCRTCGPELSHKWGNELNPDSKNNIIQIPREQFWNYYEQALETAEEIVFAGGEALMQEEHYAALDKLIELQKFDITIFYTTNLSTLKFKQVDLFETWKKFSNVNIYASLDDMGTRAEYLRKGTEWDKIEQNIIKLKNSSVKFFITPTISLFNVIHFPDFLKYMIENNLVEPNNVRVNILTSPQRNMCNILHNKQVIADKWWELISWLKQFGVDTEQYKSVINFLMTEPENKKRLVGEFSLNTYQIDSLRKENLYDSIPELKDHIEYFSTDTKTFCVFPFFNINSNTDGSVKLCCNIRENKHVKDKKGRDYNLGKDHIEDIWQSDHMENVRNNMLLGKPVEECKGCYYHEEISGTSSRTESNKFWLNNHDIKRRVREYIYDRKLHPLSSLELRLGNTCNLKCNSCWGYSSSSVNQERLAILNDQSLADKFREDWAVENSIPSHINKWFKTDVYHQNILRSAKNLSRIYLTGGEPTLIKQNRTLLNQLIDQGNKNCFVSFTTNGTVADSELLGLISNFPSNEIQISVDGIGDKANYIRYPSDWQTINGNIRKIHSIHNVNVVVYTVLSAYNLFSLRDILEYVDTLAGYKIIRWYPIILDNPSYMSTHIWPLDVRMEAVEYIKNLKLNNLSKYVSSDTFEKVYDFYSSDTKIDEIETFVMYNNTLDKHRNTNFNNVFPELSCLI